MGSCEISIMCGEGGWLHQGEVQASALLLALRDTRLLISAPPAPPAWQQHLQHHCCACHTDRYCVLLPDCPAGLLRAAAPGVVRFGGVHAPAHLPRPGAGATPWGLLLCFFPALWPAALFFPVLCGLLLGGLHAPAHLPCPGAWLTVPCRSVLSCFVARCSAPRCSVPSCSAPHCSVPCRSALLSLAPALRCTWAQQRFSSERTCLLLPLSTRW